jgi:hypothetical protein
MTDMSSLQEQSRRSFFQWHILLILKKKQLQATLEEAGYRPQALRDIEARVPHVVDSDELALLNQLGLPVPDDLSPYPLPVPEALAGIHFFFRAAPAIDQAEEFVLDFVRQLAHGGYERRELMRVAYADWEYLTQAAARFNEALSAVALPLVFRGARIWADFHGAVVMDWSPVSARLLGEAVSSSHHDWFLDLPEPDAKPAPQTKRRRINLNGRKSLFVD